MVTCISFLKVLAAVTICDLLALLQQSVEQSSKDSQFLLACQGVHYVSTVVKALLHQEQQAGSLVQSL
jgi:hypothetical protein